MYVYCMSHVMTKYLFYYWPLLRKNTAYTTRVSARRYGSPCDKYNVIHVMHKFYYIDTCTMLSRYELDEDMSSGTVGHDMERECVTVEGASAGGGRGGTGSDSRTPTAAPTGATAHTTPARPSRTPS